MNDSYRVTSVPYRLMPPQRSAIREALDAGTVTGPEIRKALDEAAGTTPEPAGDGAVSWSGPARRGWFRRLGRALARMDTWAFIVAVVTAFAAIAGAWFGYLALVKPS
jgi:hypothetical protein